MEWEEKMCAMAFDVTLTELASLSSRLITFEGPYLSNTVDGTLKKDLVQVHMLKHTHTLLCLVYSDAMSWRSTQWLRPTWWRAREAKQEQMGWGRRGTGNEGAKGGKEEREHRQSGTTIIAAHTRLHLPPAACLPPSHQIHFQYSDSSL